VALTSGGTAIATYGTVAPNVASNCGTPNAVWQFTDMNDTNFTFSGHASGNAPCTSSASSPVAFYKLDDSPVTNGSTIRARSRRARSRRCSPAGRCPRRATFSRLA
jgi:hypothetical protein